MFQKKPYKLAQVSDYFQRADSEKIHHLAAHTLNVPLKNISVVLYWDSCFNIKIVDITDHAHDCYFFTGLTLEQVEEDLKEFFGSYLYGHFKIADIKSDSFREIG